MRTEEDRRGISGIFRDRESRRESRKRFGQAAPRTAAALQCKIASNDLANQKSETALGRARRGIRVT
jgi:hypothetical protein